MKTRLLVVDDEQGIRDLFTYILDPEKYEVVTAKDGLEAVNLVKNENFDLIFMDVHMPVMRGPEAFKIIKDMYPDQKIIIFSSSSDPNFIFEKEVQKYGALTCFYKPFNVEEVLNFIETINKSVK